MNKRIEQLRKGLEVTRSGKFPVGIEKARLITASFRETDGQPQIYRNALAMAKVLDNITIFIEDGELIVGNPASKPWGVELTSLWGPWPEDEIDSLIKEGFNISESEKVEIKTIDEYWKGKHLTTRMGKIHDEERLWPYAQLGVFLPVWKNREEGGGGGQVGGGYGVHPEIGHILMAPDYEKLLRQGLNGIIEEAREELRIIRITCADSVRKTDYLKAVILAHEAIIGFARRFALLARETALIETDPLRKRELEKIAVTCEWVPANPTRSFYEAIQSFWFLFLAMNPSNVVSFGRFDQFMYPFYRSDVESGKMTDEEALELLECLRIKDMQINITGGKAHRQRQAGMMKHHNCVVGGQTHDGKDATNALSYLILDAARDCPTPHHAIAVRIHDGTPEPFILKALELAKTGTGMLSFLGDRSYIEYLLNEGVPLEVARDYIAAGCLDANVAGWSRVVAHPMFVTPLVLEMFLNNGIDRRTGKQVGPQLNDVESLVSFEGLMQAFKDYLAWFMEVHAEFNNVTMQAMAEFFPHPVESSLMIDGIKAGKPFLERTMPFENGGVANPIGMINVADSLAAIKKLIFEEKKTSMKELKAALTGNWQGKEYEELRKIFLAAPKYGNDDDYVDTIAAELYQFWARRTTAFDTVYGGKFKSAAISLMAHLPGGAETGATPDGRYAGECLADESMSAMHGRDVRGLAALIKSALKIDQMPYQATSLNLKVHPEALKNSEDVGRFSDLLKTYFMFGGKTIQLNVVGNETLMDAQIHPESHSDLIVRLGGYSGYFVQLAKDIQDEILARTEYRVV